MQLLNAVVHRLDKNRNMRGASIALATTEVVRDGPFDSLVQHVVGSYNSRCSRYAGSFEEDAENYRFSVTVKEFLDGQRDFLSFSSTAMERLRLKAAEAIFASGGFVLFVRYRLEETEMLLVAKLNSEIGAIFAEDLSHVIEAQYLNVDHLQVAARVDLSAWAESSSNYLTFVLKQERGSPSDYFREFVGCKINQDSKTESKKLAAVILAFANQQVDCGAISEEARPEVQRRAFDYAEHLRTADPPESLHFDALANAIWPQDPEEFLRFLNQHPDPPSAGFIPDRTALKRLTNINYQTRELTIKMTYEFKQEHLQVNGKDIVIRNAPDRLITEINES